MDILSISKYPWGGGGQFNRQILFVWVCRLRQWDKRRWQGKSVLEEPKESGFPGKSKKVRDTGLGITVVMDTCQILIKCQLISDHLLSIPLPPKGTEGTRVEPNFNRGQLVDHNVEASTSEQTKVHGQAGMKTTETHSATSSAFARAESVFVKWENPSRRLFNVSKC